jgi:hypothetical protein
VVFLSLVSMGSLAGFLYDGSSFCMAPVANAPDVLQPCWLIVLPLNVPTLTTSRLLEILAARGGTMWARNGR